MTNNPSETPPSLSTASTNIISESDSTSSTKVHSGNLYNISYLLKRMQNKRTSKLSLSVIKQNKSSKMTNWLFTKPIYRQSIPYDTEVHEQKLLPNNSISLINTHQQQQTIINTPIHRRSKTSQFYLDRLKSKKNKPYKRFFPLDKNEHQQFNNVAYYISYCAIIIIGVTMGGWIGGLFELISISHNGCYNKYRGYINCHIKYASLNVTIHCINTFYINSILNNSPYICLCRFRNNSKGKYRDCEFLHAKIRYI